MGTNPVRILLVAVTILGLGMALMLGRMVGSGDVMKIGFIVGGVVAATVCLSLGKKIWLLIPLCWLLTGKISVLPLPFSIQQLGILAAFGTFLMLAAFKKLDRRAESTKIDFLLWINMAYLGSVYLRNPVGTQALGSDMVGGRPYFDILVAFSGYWVLQHVTLTVKEGRIFPLLMSIGSITVAGLGILTQKFPSLVPYIAPFYNGISVQSYLAQLNGESISGTEAEYRIGPLQSFSGVTGNVLAAYYRPFSLLVFARPIASIAFYLTIAAALMAGFRSSLVGLGITMLLSSYFYAGFKDVIRIIFLMIIGVALLMAVQSSGIELPFAVQRALSFIPGPWNTDVVDAAQASTDWRVDMWKIALESDKYIHNKILGDGFGFSAYELAIQMSSAFGGTGYLGVGQTEAQLVTGAYHSGPLSAVRYVGVVGLILFTIFLFACCSYAWKLVWRAKGSPFFPLAIFVGTTAIIKPFFYLLVFGGFDSDFPGSIFTLAMLNVTHRSLEHWKKSQVSTPPAAMAQPTSEEHANMPLATSNAVFPKRSLSLN